jgi:mannitol-1-phosphate 5-dehydrogenase
LAQGILAVALLANCWPMQAELTFADVNQPLIDQLAHQQHYQVNVVGEQARVEQVSHIRAINSNSPDAIQQIAGR